MWRNEHWTFTNIQYFRRCDCFTAAACSCCVFTTWKPFVARHLRHAQMYTSPRKHMHTRAMCIQTHTQRACRRSGEEQTSSSQADISHAGHTSANRHRTSIDSWATAKQRKKKLFAFAFCSSLSFSISFCLFCCLLLIPFIVVPLRLRHSQNCFPTEKKMYIPNLLWYGSFASVQSRHLFSFYITSGIRRTTKLELHTFIYSICSKNVSSKNEAQRHGITE